jgi:iron uptake system EfeUOB component EfeO/EfeM
MGTYGRSWRNLQRELTHNGSTLPTVAAVNGCRRFSRPIGLAAVAAVAGAGLAVFLSNGDDTHTKVAAIANTIAPADLRTMEVSVTRNGCTTNMPRYPSGKLLITVNNTNATGLGTVALLQDGMRVAERESVVPGSTASIAVNLQPGKYVLSCPGTTGNQTPVAIVGPRVTTGPNTSQLLTTAGKAYSAYVSQQAGQVVRYLTNLQTYASNNRPVLSECSYSRARRSLDYIAEATGIDALGGEKLGDGWTKIGKLLFYQHTTAGVAQETAKLLGIARGLQADVAKLPFDSVNVSRSAEEQIGGIFKSVILGQAEPWSHGDMMDIYAMAQGARVATDALRPALTGIDANFVNQIDAAYSSFNQLMLRYHNGAETTGGFVGYNKLSDNTKKTISHALQAIQVPVSRIPAKLVQQ